MRILNPRKFEGLVIRQTSEEFKHTHNPSNWIVHAKTGSLGPRPKSRYKGKLSGTITLGILATNDPMKMSYKKN